MRASLALSLVLFGGRWCAGRRLVVGRHRLLARLSGRRCRGRRGARLATGARGIDLDDERGGLGCRSGLEGVKVVVCRRSARAVRGPGRLTIPYVYLAAAVADMCYAELLGGGIELETGRESGDPFCEGPVLLCGG